jgi:hypothetical protein
MQWYRTETLAMEGGGGGGGGGGALKSSWVTKRGGCNMINMETSSIYVWL